MKKHKVIIDMTNNSWTFWLRHCTYFGAFLPIILSQPILPIKTAVVRIENDITP